MLKIIGSIVATMFLTGCMALTPSSVTPDEVLLYSKQKAEISETKLKELETENKILKTQVTELSEKAEKFDNVKKALDPLVNLIDINHDGNINGSEVTEVFKDPEKAQLLFDPEVWSQILIAMFGVYAAKKHVLPKALATFHAAGREAVNGQQVNGNNSNGVKPH